MIKHNSKYHLQQINIFLLLLLFAFPILPLKVSVIVVLALSFSSIINYFFVEKVKFNFNFILLLTLIFPLLYFIEYLLNKESFHAWFEFEKRIALLAMPLLFSITQVNIKKSKLFFAYNLSVIVLAIGVFLYLLIVGINQSHLVGSLSYAVRTSIEELTSIHPTYFSFFVGFSFYLIFNNLLKNKFLWVKFLLNLIHLFVLGILLILLASKIFFISTLVIIPIIVIKSRLQIIYRIGIICFFFTLLTFSVIFMPVLNERMSELNFSKIEIPTNDEINSTNLRFGIYHCSIELLKNNPFLGVGTANLQQELNKCYDSLNISALNTRVYNTHNEYINIWLGIGLIGLLVFLSILFISFKKSLTNDEHLIFLLLFCILCFTENLLSRQHGVFMFVIFNYYFVFSKSKQVKLYN